MTTDLIETTGDVEAVAELALRGAEPREVEPGKVYVHSTPQGHNLIDLRHLTDHLPNPPRKRGQVVLHDAAGFVAYVTRHQTPATTLYGNPDGGRILAVLNDHDTGAAGWGDLRASLQVGFTREWQHWTGKDGRLLPQTDFAEHIEQGLEEIQAPPAAEMLELAQHFQATGKVAYKSVRLLQNGQRQLTYDHTIDAKAGETGQIKIPREFELALAPYEGGEPVTMLARLRYRLSGESLTIGYSLVRPHQVLRAAFDAIVAQVQEGTGLTVLRGTYGG